MAAHHHKHERHGQEAEADRPTRHVELTHPLHEYMTATGSRQSAELRALRAKTIEATGRCWGMMVPPEQANLLAFLVRLTGATRCLEVGTFTGYSALAIAEALPDGGTIVTMDVSDDDIKLASFAGHVFGMRETLFDIETGTAIFSGCASPILACHFLYASS